ncbi:MAG: MBOAT family O-acyltransferase [Phycisphaerae bacterium]
MVFSSHLFIFYYLPAVLFLYYLLPVPRWRIGWLATVSYVFYGWANPPWALIMFASTLIDYFCGLGLIRMSGLRRQADGHWEAIPPSSPRTRGMLALVVCSISANLALLAFFKYYNFTEQNLNTLALTLGSHEWVPVLRVVLPAGVSFYTFKSMSYCIDVYRGEAPPMSNFIDFNAFEAMFPDLVAGPIIRYGAIAEQMRHRSHTADKFARGIAFLACGLAKKILIANPLGYLADASFEAASRHALDAWTGLLAYAFQIYFDFSGYSDIAVGLGLMFGFVFIKNFDGPYRAESITDFWRRWHISLSTWLRDYLYIPLGGNRKGPARAYLNLLVVMLLGGLWHGASWTFVVWGAIHGLMLMVERYGGKESAYRRLPAMVRVTITFGVVCLAWVFFRAEHLSDAGQYLASLVGLGPQASGMDLVAGVMYTRYHLALLLLAGVIVWFAPQTWAFTSRLTPVRAAWCMLLLSVAIVFMWTQTENPFLYFQF